MYLYKKCCGIGCHKGGTKCVSLEWGREGGTGAIGVIGRCGGPFEAGYGWVGGWWRAGRVEQG